MKTRTPQTSFLTFFSLLLLALDLAGQTAKATQAMQEAFDYTTSVVVGNSVLVSGTSRTWALTSGTDNTLVSGDLTYHGLNTPTVANSKMVSVANSVAGRDNLTLISTGASTTEYFSFLLKVTGTEPSTSGQAIMNVAASSSSAAGGGGAFTVFIKGTDATHYQVGIQAGSGTGTFETAAHVCGASADTVLVVVKYVNGSISLWVNPSSSTFGGGSDPSLPITSTASTTAWKFYIIDGIAASGAGAFNMDNLRMGTGYADVAPSSSAPAQPTLTAVTSPSTTGYTINWGAVSGATGYRVDVASDSGFASILSGYNDVDVTSGISLAVSGLSPNTTYWYRVRAYNATGISASASTSQATCPTLSGPPSPAPTTVTSVCQPVTASWTAVANATGYNIYRSSGGAYSLVGSVSGNGTVTYNDNAPTGNSYTYEVSAVGGACETALSDPSSPAITPTGAPAAPVTPTVTVGCDLTVNWVTVGGASSYNVYRKSSSDVSYSQIAAGQTGTSYEDTAANDSTKTYQYEVTAVSSCESALSPASAAATPTHTDITAQPASFTTGDAGYYKASFTVAANNANSYQWQVNNGSGWVPVNGGVGVDTGSDGSGGLTATFTTVNVTGTMNGYQYRCAVSGNCNSPTSGAATLNVATYFKSLASGNWSASSTWQISVDGSAWTPAPSGVLPTNTDTVEIQSPNVVTLDTSGNIYAAKSLTIDAGGAIAGVTTSGENQLWLYGNLVNNNGTAGFNGAGSSSTRIYFAANATWTGSADNSGCKLKWIVNSGVTLDLSGATTDFKMRSSGTITFTVNGTLIVGNHVINGNSSGASFILGPGATLQTANPNGISGATATLNFAAGLTLDPTANYVFNGTANQASTGLPATINSLTINNTGASGNNTVTLGATTLSGVLYIQSGLLSFGGTLTSTAYALTYDNLNYQATGTWGSTNSTATHTDDARFAPDASIVTVSGPMAIGSSTQFRSKTSGNWNVAGTWEMSNDSGTTWYPVMTGFTPGSMPGSTHTVYIQSAHKVTLTENEACGDLHICQGATGSSSTLLGIIVLGGNTLSVNGQLREYYGTVGTIPGATGTSGFSIYPFTAATGGKVSIVGNSRNLFNGTTWNATIGTPATGAFPLSIDVSAGQTVTLNSGMKVSSCAVNSGTLDIVSVSFRLDNGTAGQGDVTIASGARLRSSLSGAASPQFGRTSTAGSANAAGKLWVKSGGTLEFYGTTPTAEMTSYQFDGTVDYSKAGSQTLLAKPTSPDPNDAALDTYTDLILEGSNTKTPAVNTTVNGTLTVNSGTTLDFNSLNMNLANPPMLNGGLNFEVNKTGANTFTGSMLTLNSGTLTFGGTLTVTNTSSVNTLALGDSIPLFTSSGGFGSGFGSVTVLPATGLSGTVSGGNLTIACDGTLLASAGSPPAAICAGTPVEIGGSPTASGGSGLGTYSYSWSPGGATVANPTVSPTTTTLYTVTVTDANGCTAQSPVTVNVNPLPTTSAISGPAAFNINQVGVTYSVTATAGSSYAWTVPSDASITAGSTGPNNSQIAVTFGSASGNITVTETTSGGCVGTPVSLAVKANHPPVAPPNKTLVTVKNSAATFAKVKLLADATDADSDTLTVTAASTPTHGATILEANDVKYTPATDYTGPDSYTYTISDGNGGTTIGTVDVTVALDSGLSPNRVGDPAFDSGTGTFSVTFAGIPTITYTVEYAVGSAAPPWTKLRNITAGPLGLFTATDGPGLSGSRYYRTVWPSY